MANVTTEEKKTTSTNKTTTKTSSATKTTAAPKAKKLTMAMLKKQVLTLSTAADAYKITTKQLEKHYATVDLAECFENTSDVRTLTQEQYYENLPKGMTRQIVDGVHRMDEAWMNSGILAAGHDIPKGRSEAIIESPTAKATLHFNTAPESPSVQIEATHSRDYTSIIEELMTAVGDVEI